MASYCVLPLHLLLLKQLLLRQLLLLRCRMASSQLPSPRASSGNAQAKAKEKATATVRQSAYKAQVPSAALPRRWPVKPRWLQWLHQSLYFDRELVHRYLQVHR